MNNQHRNEIPSQNKGGNFQKEFECRTGGTTHIIRMDDSRKNAKQEKWDGRVVVDLGKQDTKK